MMRNRISRTFPLLSLLIAFIASPAFAQGGSVTRIEQNDPSITYSGNWYSNASSLHSGGDATLTNARGAMATITFTGTGITWIGVSDPWSGLANVYIDGRLQVIDSYSDTGRYQQPLFAVRTMESYVDDALAQPRFRSSLISLFAGIALLLAALGVYAVISYSVAQRTHEIGIRMTLGARTPDVVKLVLGQGLPPILVGTFIGLVTALAFSRVLESLLYGVSARDPATFAGVSLLLVWVALTACFLPARRAARVDPMIALRYE